MFQGTQPPPSAVFVHLAAFRSFPAPCKSRHTGSEDLPLQPLISCNYIWMSCQFPLSSHRNWINILLTRGDDLHTPHNGRTRITRDLWRMGKGLVYSQVLPEKEVFTCKETLWRRPTLVNTFSFKWNIVWPCSVRQCPGLRRAVRLQWQIHRIDIRTVKSDKQIKSVVKSRRFTKQNYLPKSASFFFPQPLCFCSNVEKKITFFTVFILVPTCKFCCVNTSAWSQKTFPSANSFPPQHYWALQILPPWTAGRKTQLIMLSAGQQGGGGCLSENLNNNTFLTHLGVVAILRW